MPPVGARTLTEWMTCFVQDTGATRMSGASSHPSNRDPKRAKHSMSDVVVGGDGNVAGKEITNVAEDASSAKSSAQHDLLHLALAWSSASAPSLLTRETRLLPWKQIPQMRRGNGWESRHRRRRSQHSRRPSKHSRHPSQRSRHPSQRSPSQQQLRQRQQPQ